MCLLQFWRQGSPGWQSRLHSETSCVSGSHLTLCSHDLVFVCAQRENKLSGVCCYKATNPIRDSFLVTSSNSDYPLKASFPNNIILGVKSSPYEFGGEGEHNLVHNWKHNWQDLLVAWKWGGKMGEGVRKNLSFLVCLIGLSELTS